MLRAMSTPRLAPTLVAGALFSWLGLAAGCAATLVAGTMPNPAKSADKLESTQEYDIGPYKEDHRFVMTLQGWTATSLGVRIKLADVGDCGLAASYAYTLVDDNGGRHPMQPTDPPAQTTEPGRGNVTLTVSTFAGRFDVPIGADAHAVTVEQRPQPGHPCPALDFRWTFQ
jgi:hypothetical protein